MKGDILHQDENIPKESTPRIMLELGLD